ncbi:MAG: nuclear transport factor 2 family protein [Chitinophagales bacterium]
MDQTQVIDKFYSAFTRLDYKTMQQCYSDDAVFSDPVFGILSAAEVRAMWEMLCRNAQDFSLVYGDIEILDAEYATCKWIATYTFSKTGKKVMNHIKAHMRIVNGKIIEHSDAFKISNWAAQALGFKGLLFGWTNFMKKGIQKNARKNLEKFMGSSNTATG